MNNNAPPSPAAVQASRAHSPPITQLCPEPALDRCKPNPEIASDGIDGAQSNLSDNEREFLIRRAGRMMRLAMARYERSGCFSDRGLADYWRLTMQADIRARSAAQVARMELERGLT